MDFLGDVVVSPEIDLAGENLKLMVLSPEFDLLGVFLNLTQSIQE